MAPITSTAVDTALAPNRFKDFWWSHEGEGFTIDVYGAVRNVVSHGQDPQSCQAGQKNVLIAATS
jgi:hypothetical protein